MGRLMPQNIQNCRKFSVFVPAQISLSGKIPGSPRLRTVLQGMEKSGGGEFISAK